MAMNQHGARFLAKSAGSNLSVARAHLERAMNDAKRDAVLAYRQGISISEISRLTGLSRQTIYDALDDADVKIKERS